MICRTRSIPWSPSQIRKCSTTPISTTVLHVTLAYSWALTKAANTSLRVVASEGVAASWSSPSTSYCETLHRWVSPFCLDRLSSNTARMAVSWGWLGCNWMAVGSKLHSLRAILRVNGNLREGHWLIACASSDNVTICWCYCGWFELTRV